MASMTYRSSSVRARLFDDALREAMQTPIPESGAVEVTPAADPAAGTVSPKPHPPQVKFYGLVVDADTDRAYGDGVEDSHTLDVLSGGHKPSLHSSTPSAEYARLARLRLWQAQRP